MEEEVIDIVDEDEDEVSVENIKKRTQIANHFKISDNKYCSKTFSMTSTSASLRSS